MDDGLKAIYEKAYDLLAPFFAPENQWAGQNHEHLAYMALHEAFPELRPEQLTTIVTAMKTLFTKGSAAGSGPVGS